MPDDNTKTFADMVLQQEGPTTQDPATEFDLPGSSLFRDVSKDVMGPNETNGAVQLAYRSFSKVFILWRPWQNCERCRKAIAAATDETVEEEGVELPTVGEYTCPHTQETDFKVIRDKILRGDAIRDREDFFHLVDESRCVQILWLEPDPASLRQLKKMEQVRKTMSNIYPHVPDKKTG